MAERRPSLARRILGLIGDSVEAVDYGTGWPTHIRVKTTHGLIPVALHVSRVSPHSREDWEWRFQNPASATPVTVQDGELPVLIGLDEINGKPVLVAVDGASRLGRSKRFGVLFNKRIAREAARSGWSDQVSTSDETIYAMSPGLFPLLVELLSAGVERQLERVDEAGLRDILDKSDVFAERTRRTVSAYVRDRKFSRDVRAAYEDRCAMCSVGLGLVVGAHILPVEAPSAPDAVWNGIALCHNHHAAFDAHKLWIGRDYSIQRSSALEDEAEHHEPSRKFLELTRETLWLPAHMRLRPRTKMLEGRYAYYGSKYAWAPTF